MPIALRNNLRQFLLRVTLDYCLSFIYREQALDAVLLNHDVDTTSGDAHDLGLLPAFGAIGACLQALEVEISVELGGGH